MNTKPLGQMTVDEIAALTPEEFKQLADEHNDRSELQENARNREIESETAEMKALSDEKIKAKLQDASLDVDEFGSLASKRRYDALKAERDRRGDGKEERNQDGWCPNGCQHLHGLGECGACGYAGPGVPQHETDFVIEANDETGRFERIPHDKNEEVDFSPLLDPAEEVERPCTCGINNYDIEPPYDAFTKGCRDEVGEILGDLLQPRPSAPPPFDPKHAREDLTPTRRGILGAAKEIGRAVVDVLLSKDPEIQRSSPDEFKKTQTLTETADRKSRHGRRLERDDRRW